MNRIAKTLALLLSGVSLACSSSSGHASVTAGAGGVGVGGATASTGGATDTGGGGAGGQVANSGGSAGSADAGAGGSAGSPTAVQLPDGCTCLGVGAPACVPTGHITYTLAMSANPTADEQSAYDAIRCAVEGALAYYNCYTDITAEIRVSYDPSVPTADGNINGSLRFGGRQYMQCVTGMHEISHTQGIGTASNWGTFSVGGVFTGETAIAELRAITSDPTAVLHSDTQHFWPYGLNYESEAGSTDDLVNHCRMVTAIRTDLGLN